MNKSKIIILAASALIFSACASQKNVTAGNHGTAAASKTVSKPDDAAQLDFLDKVNSNASYQKNVSASITFHVSQDNGKEITIPGQLRMRKDEVVRLSLQMPLIGTEVGRLEFTKDYVLIVDRMHKQYVKANYSQVGFLHDNGITFYSLQALFWNRLLLPGKTTVNYTDLTKFHADLGGASQQVPVTITDGKLKYTWTAQRTSGLIDKARVDYDSKGHGTSTLTWDYANLTTFGSKMFPYSNAITISTPATGKAKTIKASYEINSISTTSDWEATTTLSNKYKQVSVEEVLGKLTNN